MTTDFSAYLSKLPAPPKALAELQLQRPSRDHVLVTVAVLGALGLGVAIGYYAANRGACCGACDCCDDNGQCGDACSCD